jgi:hypothetical protein
VKSPRFADERGRLVISPLWDLRGEEISGEAAAHGAHRPNRSELHPGEPLPRRRILSTYPAETGVLSPRFGDGRGVVGD